MNALRCLRAVARPAMATPSMAQAARNMSLLSARRPMLAPASLPSTLAAPGAPAAATRSPETLDIMGKISASPAFAGVQIRCGPRDTYNPSHFVRKRRHGFLNRLRSKKGRKLLMRRLTRGRWNLSH
ncbi:ribosomal protein L34-domain-containing protein [Boeremia exigua]|uniref:ribosomal protein L34-domain-containing protein n=1 Tax=Boeremia exigua TaxID=749465 RepID=UPI001E8DA3E2|nr:ribosomal protein L34-domain-containing protein [Boeremia exigua]KAH6612734.1 ribosomal protein L34-domain-containing protein [Boeremia exigua]